MGEVDRGCGGCNMFTSTGVILVLFILLVIITVLVSSKAIFMGLSTDARVYDRTSQNRNRLQLEAVFFILKFTLTLTL